MEGKMKKFAINKTGKGCEVEEEVGSEGDCGQGEGEGWG
jgi:hypothetical protein